MIRGIEYNRKTKKLFIRVEGEPDIIAKESYFVDQSINDAITLVSKDEIDKAAKEEIEAQISVIAADDPKREMKLLKINSDDNIKKVYQFIKNRKVAKKARELGKEKHAKILTKIENFLDKLEL